MIAIVDTGGANITSILFALQRLGVDALLTRDASLINAASKVILPGVGAAKDAMTKIKSYGLLETLQNLTQPVLGICLGMQLLYQHSEEGEVDCLGVIPGTVIKLPQQPQLTIPHMGWNQLHDLKTSLFTGIDNGSYVYFVHSYCAPINDYTCASAIHGQPFTAAVQKDNYFATQFHPEKSSDIGARVLQNFLEKV